MRPHFSSTLRGPFSLCVTASAEAYASDVLVSADEGRLGEPAYSHRQKSYPDGVRYGSSFYTCLIPPIPTCAATFSVRTRPSASESARQGRPTAGRARTQAGCPTSHTQRTLLKKLYLLNRILPF